MYETCPWGGARRGAPAWRVVGALAVTETVSWGVLYYAFAVFLAPMERDLGASPAELTGASRCRCSSRASRASASGATWTDTAARADDGRLVGGVACVLAWSRVDGLLGYYAVWVLAGLAMAAVLYEPAFTLVANGSRAGERRGDHGGHPGRRRLELRLPAALTGPHRRHGWRTRSSCSRRSSAS